MNKISVIFCHHKGDFIHKAVETVLKSRGVEVEVIVATSAEGLKLPKEVKVIEIEGGPAHKRNMAYRFATHPYIAFYDDDVEIDKDSLIEMYKICKRQDVGMVFSKLMNMEFPDRFDEAGGFLTWTGFIWSRAESNLKDVGQYNKTEEIFAGKSAACMIKRKVFWKIGGFDKSFEILGEETDLAWRVWISGYKVMFCPKSYVAHAFNTKYKPIDFYTHQRVYFNGCRNYITMLASNLEKRNLIKILPVHVMSWIVAGLGMLLTGKPRASYHIFRGLVYCLKNIRWIRLKRKKVAEIRIKSDKELFKTIYKKVRIGYYLERLRRYFVVGLHG